MLIFPISDAINKSIGKKVIGLIPFIVHLLQQVVSLVQTKRVTVFSVELCRYLHSFFILRWNGKHDSKPIIKANKKCWQLKYQLKLDLQKLAGGRRGSRAWFLENWQNSKGHKHFECEDADIENIPIELRRLDNSSVLIDKQTDNLSIKSKSLGDILEIQRLDLVRSRSSIPGLCSTLTSDLYLNSQSIESFSSGSKPKLVKQKSHLNDECLEITPNTAIQNVSSDLPDFQVNWIKKIEMFFKNVSKIKKLEQICKFVGIVGGVCETW